MKKYDVIFFDLDGTIIDSGEGVTNSVSYALEKLRIEPLSKSKLRKFIGPPLAVSFPTYAGVAKDDVEKAIKYYREYYTSKGIFEGYVYENIEKMLEILKSNKKHLVVATSKPEEFAKSILKRAGLDKYFDHIAGATMDEKTRATKDDVIRYALDLCQITDTSSVLMVGDRCYDIEGARHFGIECMAVLYGYGSYEEFIEYKADYIAETPLEVAEKILE
ncbi:MAG: HAD-IA family hydrolase [Clostridia bacterium]|nr:HAD-IA family hydrolase [Clostridia bacterium]